MTTDLVAGLEDGAHVVRPLAHALADQKEGRARVVLTEQVEDLASPLRGPVVEGERELQAARTNSPAAALSAIGPAVRWSSSRRISEPGT